MQDKLSSFDAGDPDDLDLRTDSYEERRRTEEYAERVACGGWELASVTTDTVSWWNPDGDGVYSLERKKAGWHGVHGTRDASPRYTQELQTAIDKAGEYMSENPVSE